jgi:hypothetical protein
MEEHPQKHRRFGRERNRPSHNVKTNHTSEKKSFDNFLIKSGIKPLVFVGQCAQYFGFLTVVAFLVGAAAVYGYALFRPLPYSKASQAEPLKKVWLHGKVKDNAKPRNGEFEIGVLATRQGPFEDGSYAIEVPESARYEVTLWNPGYKEFKLAQLKADSAGNVNDVNFPSDLEKPEVTANKQGSDPDVSAPAEDRRVRERAQLSLIAGKRNGQ